MPVGRLSLLQPAEVDTLLNKFNAAEVPPSELLHEQQTLHGLLEHWASATPEAPAAEYKVCPPPPACTFRSVLPASYFFFTGHVVPGIIIDAARKRFIFNGPLQDEVLSYSELDKRANQLARRLIALGVGPEVPVGVMIPRSLHLVVALLGVIKAGGAYVPMDPDYPPDRLALMLEDSEVGLCAVMFAPQLLTATRSLDPQQLRCNDQKLLHKNLCCNAAAALA